MNRDPNENCCQQEIPTKGFEGRLECLSNDLSWSLPFLLRMSQPGCDVTSRNGLRIEGTLNLAKKPVFFFSWGASIAAVVLD